MARLCNLIQNDSFCSAESIAAQLLRKGQKKFYLLPVGPRKLTTNSFNPPSSVTSWLLSILSGGERVKKKYFIEEGKRTMNDKYKFLNFI